MPVGHMMHLRLQWFVDSMYTRSGTIGPESAPRRYAANFTGMLSVVRSALRQRRHRDGRSSGGRDARSRDCDMVLLLAGEAAVLADDVGALHAAHEEVAREHRGPQTDEPGIERPHDAADAAPGEPPRIEAAAP